jgi:hypothetical protein
MTNKHRDEDLKGQLNSPGWRLTGDHPQKPVTGTLNDVLIESHSRKSRGEHPGRIQQIVTAIELDMIQIEQLWRQLGLPTI